MHMHMHMHVSRVDAIGARRRRAALQRTARHAHRPRCEPRLLGGARARRTCGARRRDARHRRRRGGRWRAARRAGSAPGGRPLVRGALPRHGLPAAEPLVCAAAPRAAAARDGALDAEVPAPHCLALRAQWLVHAHCSLLTAHCSLLTTHILLAHPTSTSDCLLLTPQCPPRSGRARPYSPSCSTRTRSSSRRRASSCCRTP